MRLDHALDGLSSVVIVGDPSTEVRDVVIDDRGVVDGSLFVCLRGATTDGHDHAEAAQARGATALLCERPLALDVAHAVVPDSRVAMAPVAAAVYGHPSHALAVIGVTGTNGKTTTTHLLAHVLDHAGLACTTVGTLTGGFSTPTTPEAPLLQAALAQALNEGKAAAAIEVSSHALMRHRVDATRFAVAVFTNLSQDHLEEHGTMDAYFEAKASLFTEHEVGAAVVCTDDRWGRALVERIRGLHLPLRTYSSEDVADDGSIRWDERAVRVPLPGRHNALNALAAAHAADVLGVAPAAVADALGRAPGVPGRFEVVDAGQPFTVMVDYCHTPDALLVALGEARRLAGGARTVVVFGCGGERDHTKRGPMGEAAALLADVVVVTTDNPRHEDPDAIIAEVVAGTRSSGARQDVEVLIIPDRRAAIARAVGLARVGDVVLLAGKGHEPYQEVQGVKHHLDDREEAVAALADLGWRR